MLRHRAKGTYDPSHAIPSFTSIHPRKPTHPTTNIPQIDYDRFHKLAGLASVASARELMRVTKNKLKSEYGALGADLQAANAGIKTPSKSASATPTKGSPTKAATPGKKTASSATPASRKRGAGKKSHAEVEDDSEADGEGESPTKKVKKECDAEEKGGEADGEGSD